ncbi:MAG: YlxM family DNA-binding protein [Ruminiclostridium sp.]|jgi:predicted DNA-binding protein YlxM (UPF0122 family)|nr:YlxM family DNA-binding protein [Ruminiclostridium sp.]MCI9466428.1 YlxM family DNA-binding protein [Ruminiclostridium sp.]
MKSQAYRMAMLYDFYGDLLTQRQKEFFDLYYNDDLSLAEIAENYDITRQGVRDIIVRAERTLEDIEEKTGLIQRHQHTRSCTAVLHELCDQLQALNRAKLESNKEVQVLCMQLRKAIEALEKD